MSTIRLISLCCLPALCIVSLPVRGEELVVAPGEVLRLEVPEADARLEAALGGGLLAPIEGSLKAPDAGEHWLAMASRDPSGNLSPIRWIRLRIDDQPPEVELRIQPLPVETDSGHRWVPAGSEVTLSGSDELAGVAELFLAVGQEVQETSEATLSARLPGDGDVVVRAWALDRVGNRSADSTLTVSIDDIPVAGEIVACTDAVESAVGLVLAPDCGLTANLLESGSGVRSLQIWIDGEEAPAQALEGPWSAGQHVVEALATDLVGNQARWDKVRFTVDVAGPEITWRILDEGAESSEGERFHRSPVRLDLAAKDSTAGLDRLAAATDGGTFAPVDGPVAVAGEELVLRAWDRVGNLTETRATWRIDAEPPEVELVTTRGEHDSEGGLILIAGESIQITAVDHGVGLADAAYSLNGSPMRPMPRGIEFAQPGKFDLAVEVVDQLGNRASRSWRIDVRRSRKGGR